MALALVVEVAAQLARGAMRLAEVFVRIAGWAREEARREHCHLCKTGSVTARASCWKRTGSLDRCALSAGPGRDA